MREGLRCLKEAAGYRSDGFFAVEKCGGKVFRVTKDRSWIYFDNPLELCSHPIKHTIWLCHRHYAGSWYDPLVHPQRPDSWAHCFLGIEFNPRFVGGWGNMLALLPSIPCSRFGTRTVVVARGLFRPRPGGSYYSMDLSSEFGDDGFDEGNFGYVPGRIEFWDRRMLVRAWHELAKIRGLRTGLVMLTNSEQVYLDGHPIDWDDPWQQEVYAGKLAHAVSLGADLLYVDSGRHAGRCFGGHWCDVWDSGLYCGAGRPIPAPVLGRILYLIREKSGRPDLAVFGEGTDPLCAGDESPGITRYRSEMGMTGGIVHDSNKSEHDIWWLTESQRGTAFPVGFRIVDDNDGGADWCWLLGATDRVLKWQANMSSVPVWTNMSPLVPMYGTNYHDALLHPCHSWDHSHPDSGWFRWRWNQILAEASG